MRHVRQAKPSDCINNPPRTQTMITAKLCIAALALVVGIAIAGDFDDVQSAVQRKNFVSAVKLLQPLAERGDRRAQAFLAYVTVYRNDVPKDFPAAVIWTQKAADQGEAMGKVLLGMLYLNGQGVQQDEEQGVTLIRQAAASNHPFALYELGKLMLVGRGTAQDVGEGESLLKKAAASFPEIKEYAELIVRRATELDQWRKGLSRLSCGVSCAIRSGSNRQRLKEDYESMLWVELAAGTLDVGFQSNLAYFYLGRASEGLGDLREALIYYDLAMNPRQFGQPCDYLTNNCGGVVLPRDALDRRNLVTVAIQDKSKREAERLALAAKTRQAAELAEATRLASEQEALSLKELAQRFSEDRQKAEQGSSDAQYRLARMYFAGKGTPIDEQTGLIWLAKAAQQGYSDAQYDLGERYRKGLSVSQDNLKAEMWLRKAIQQGHVDTEGGLAALLADKQERATAAAEVAKKRAAAAAAVEKKKEEERAELARKTKLENAAKLKSL